MKYDTKGVNVISIVAGGGAEVDDQHSSSGLSRSVAEMFQCQVQLLIANDGACDIRTLY